MASPRGHYPLRCHNGGSAVPLHNSVVCLNATARPPSLAAASAANAANAADVADAAACNAACSATGAKQQGPLSGESLCLWIAIGATVGNIIVVVVVYVCTFYEKFPAMVGTSIAQGHGFAIARNYSPRRTSIFIIPWPPLSGRRRSSGLASLGGVAGGGAAGATGMTGQPVEAAWRSRAYAWLAVIAIVGNLVVLGMVYVCT